MELKKELESNQLELIGGAKIRYYSIHDNGGRPFRVGIEKRSRDYKVTVYKQIGLDDNPGEYENKIKYDDTPIVFKAKKVFIGKSPINKMTKFSGGYGPRFDGNSILLHVSGKKYIYIGWEIYSFNAKSEIVSYTSPVGNNDVPYPSAVDIDGNVYLMVEDVMFDANDVFDKMKKGDTIYDYYYEDMFWSKTQTLKDLIKPIKKKIIQKRITG